VAFDFGFFPCSGQRVKTANSDLGCVASDLENLAVVKRRLAETAILCSEAIHKIVLSRACSSPLRCQTEQSIVALTFINETCFQRWSRAANRLRCHCNEPRRSIYDCALFLRPLIAKPGGVNRRGSDYACTSGAYIQPFAQQTGLVVQICTDRAIEVKMKACAFSALALASCESAERLREPLFGL